MARRAGVPQPVINAARRYLAELEAQRDAHAAAAPSPQGMLPFHPEPEALPPAAPLPDGLRGRLAEIDPDALSPRDAHALLYELRSLAEEDS